MGAQARVNPALAFRAQAMQQVVDALTAEARGVEEIIDPRDPRTLLVEWARRAPSTTPFPAPRKRGVRAETFLSLGRPGARGQ